MKFFADHNEDIKAVTLKNALNNLELTTLEIQKDTARAIAIETINVIIKDLGNAFFSILVDESRDLSRKEKMDVVLRYVDKKGQIIERLVSIEHVVVVPVFFKN